MWSPFPYPKASILYYDWASSEWNCNVTRIDFRLKSISDPHTIYMYLPEVDWTDCDLIVLNPLTQNVCKCSQDRITCRSDCDWSVGASRPLYAQLSIHDFFYYILVCRVYWFPETSPTKSTTHSFYMYSFAVHFFLTCFNVLALIDHHTIWELYFRTKMSLDH